MTGKVSNCKCASRFLQETSAKIRRWRADAAQMIPADWKPEDGFTAAPVWVPPEVFLIDCPQLCAEAEGILASPHHRGIRVERSALGADSFQGSR